MSAPTPADAGRVLMVGCGAMGGAMLRRWLGAGMAPEQLTVISPSGRAMPDGVRVIPRYEPGDFRTMVLALKPQQLREVHGSLAELAPDLLVSILAGVELATLRDMWRTGMTVRAMPNLPVGIGKGVVALHADGDRSASLESVLDALMEPLGMREWIADEGHFDAVTALAGSGPAFLFRFVDALGAAGAALGLPEDQARRLALATVEGAAIMAAAADESPAALADRVASKGGSTREGLDVLDRDGVLVQMLTDTLAAAARRNRDMAVAARG